MVVTLMEAREKLLTAGMRLFAEKGFAAVSIRELSQAADTNSALISYYFGGKEGLYSAVLEKQFAAVDETIATVNESCLSPVERIEAYAKAVCRTHMENPFIIRFLYSEFANPTPAFQVIQQEVGKIFRFLCQTIKDGIERGQFRSDLKPEHAALVIAGMMNFYFISRPLRQSFLPKAEDRELQYFEDALKIYLDGVRKHDN